MKNKNGSLLPVPPQHSAPLPAPIPPHQQRARQAAAPYIERHRAGEAWHELYSEARNAVSPEFSSHVTMMIYQAEEALARKVSAPYIEQHRAGSNFFVLYEALEETGHSIACDIFRKAATKMARATGNLSLEKSYLQHNNLKSFFAKRRTGGEDDRSRLATEHLVALWAKQGGRCALTGWKMTLDRRPGGNICNASIDCKKPRAKGGIYELENIQLVCRFANQARRDMNIEDFVTQWRAAETNNYGAAGVDCG